MCLHCRADFACEVAEVTGGVGVDMVLNSLTSSGMIAASLACMGRAGRFVEVGKNGIWSAARMAQVRAQGPDVSVKGCEGRLPSGPLACTTDATGAP